MNYGMNVFCRYGWRMTSSGKKRFRYVAAVKILNKFKREGLFIKKNDFLDYLRKYPRFIGYVFDQNGAVQHSQKGETLEQKWIRLLKCDSGYEGYIKLAMYIKNNVMLSIISHIEEIIKRVSTQTVSSDSMNKTIKYLEVLKSGEVKWDDADNQILNEIHSLIFRKKMHPYSYSFSIN